MTVIVLETNDRLRKPFGRYCELFQRSSVKNAKFNPSTIGPANLIMKRAAEFVCDAGHNIADGVRRLRPLSGWPPS